MTATKSVTGERLSTVPCKMRIQNPAYSSWNTLRYDDLGECEVVADGGYSNEECSEFGGSIIIRHEGVLKCASLSITDDLQHVAVLPEGKGWRELPEWAIPALLKLKEGKKGKVKHNGRTYEVSRKMHPTTASTVVLGLR